MASTTKVTEIRTRNKHRKMGRKRKVAMQKRGTTPSYAALFGESSAQSSVAKS